MDPTQYKKLLKWIAPALSALIVACSTEPAQPIEPISQPGPVSSSALVGVDGDFTVTTTGQVLNRYALLRADVSVGDTSLQVNNLTNLDSPIAQLGPLAEGDLLMIIQMQGATINNTDTEAFGAVTALNGAGTYEFVSVSSIRPEAGGWGTIFINTESCGGLRNAYTAAGCAAVRHADRQRRSERGGYALEWLVWRCHRAAGAELADVERKFGRERHWLPGWLGGADV